MRKTRQSRIERLSIECLKIKTKAITLANHKGHRQSTNQSKLIVNTCSWLKARENVSKQVAIGFGFTSNWIKKWWQFYKPGLYNAIAHN